MWDYTFHTGLADCPLYLGQWICDLTPLLIVIRRHSMGSLNHTV